MSNLGDAITRALQAKQQGRRLGANATEPEETEEEKKKRLDMMAQDKKLSYNSEK